MDQTTDQAVDNSDLYTQVKIVPLHVRIVSILLIVIGIFGTIVYFLLAGMLSFF